MFTVEKKRIVQPKAFLGVEKTGIARDLVLAVNLQNGIVRNAVNGEVAVLTGTAATPSSSCGLEGKLFATASYAFSKPGAPASTDNFTILVIQNYKSDASASQAPISFNNKFFLYAPNSATYREIYFYSAGTEGGLSGNYVISAGKSQTIVVKKETTTLSSYIDGKAQSPTATFGGTWSSGTTKIGIGYDTTQYCKSELDLVLVWKRALSYLEIKSISANPWQVFKSYHTFIPSLPDSGTTHTVSDTESATATEAVSSVNAAVATLTESATATDSDSAIAAVISTLSESVSSSESLSATIQSARSLDETLSAVDLASAGKLTASTVTESGSLSDSASTLLSAVGDRSESASSSDLASVTASFVASVSESLSATDVFNIAGQALTSSASESVSAVDSASALSLRVVSVSESSSLTDALSSTSSRVASLSEAISATDTVLSIKATSATTSESLSATDTALSVKSTASSLSESATATDSESATSVSGSASIIIESFSATDTTSATGALIAAVSESGAISDAVSAIMARVAAIAETTTASSAQSYSDIFTVSALEAVSALDTAFGVITVPPTEDLSHYSYYIVKAKNNSLTVNAKDSALTVNANSAFYLKILER